MSQDSTLEVINKEGWRKEYPLQKNIVYIGSASTNDITLESLHGAGVAPMHVQLIASGNGKVGYKLINLSDSAISLGTAGDSALPPRGVLDMTDGQMFVLGDFTLVFRGNGRPQPDSGSRPAVAAYGDGSPHIGLTLSMPYTRLAPHQSIEGMVTVTNQGEKTGVGFDLQLEGLDPDCFDIAPGPLLSSGAQKNVVFRVHHRGIKPLAGDWQITIRATAPKGYPGEQAVVSQVIQVLPFYRHRIQLLPAKGITSSTPPDDALSEANLLTPIAQGSFLSQRGAAQDQPETTPEDVWGSSDEPEEAQPAALKLKAKPAPPAKMPDTPVIPRPPAAAEDLWAAPVESAPPLQVQAPLSPEAEDLWAAPVESVPETAAETGFETPAETGSPATEAPDQPETWWAEPEPLLDSGPPLETEAEAQAPSEPPAQESEPLTETAIEQKEPASVEMPPVSPIAAVAAASAIAVKEAVAEPEPPPDNRPTATEPATASPAVESAAATQAGTPAVRQSPVMPDQPAAPPVSMDEVAASKESPTGSQMSSPATDETAEKPGWWTKITQSVPFGRDKEKTILQDDDQLEAAPSAPAVEPIEASAPVESEIAPALQTERPAIQPDSMDAPPPPAPEEELAVTPTETVLPESDAPAIIGPDIQPEPEALLPDAMDETAEASQPELAPVTAQPDPGTTVQMRDQKAANDEVPDRGAEGAEADETETIIFEPKRTRPLQPEPETAATTALWETNAPTLEAPEEATLKIKAAPTQPAPEQPAEEDAAEIDDWWTDETETVEEEPEALAQQAIKLKASPPPRVSKKQPAETDDWWSADDE